MNSRGISGNILSQSCSLQDAMLRLNQGVGGILLCVDGDGTMRGVMTDGDIRRALLAGGKLDSPVEAHMNRKFVSGRAAAPREENLKLLGTVVRHVPLIDEQGRPADLLSWDDLWRLPVSTPSLGGNEMKYVADCIETVWISSQGGYVDRFQAAFVDYLGQGGQALCTSSGTTALHLALVALDVKPGDQVIVPDITFGACANVVMQAGAEPVFVDIDPNTWTIDIAAFEAAITPKTKAVMPVHLYGHPCDMDPLMEVARAHGLKVVEDCAESLGAEYKGRKVGTIGDVGCFSFFANKVITTGEGGMVVSSDAGLLERMALLRDHGMRRDRRYWHVEPGFNYRMTNLQAAVGLAQMERIDEFLTRRAEIVKAYDAGLAKIEGIQRPPRPNWGRNIHWLYSVMVDPAAFGMDRHALAERLNAKGIETRPVFAPLHVQPAFGQNQAAAFPVSTSFAERGLSLPTSNAMTAEDAERVCRAVQEIAAGN